MTSDTPLTNDLLSSVNKMSRSSSYSTTTEPFPPLSLNSTPPDSQPTTSPEPNPTLQSLALSPRFPNSESSPSPSPSPSIPTPDRAPSPLNLLVLPPPAISLSASSEPGSPAPPQPISEHDLIRAEPVHLLSPARRQSVQRTLETLETRVAELDLRLRRARDLLERLYGTERMQRRRGLRARYVEEDPEQSPESSSPDTGTAGIGVPHERFDRHSLQAGDDELKTWTQRMEYLVEAMKKESSLLKGAARCAEWVRDAEVGSGVGRGEVRWLERVLGEFGGYVGGD